MKASVYRLLAAAAIGALLALSSGQSIVAAAGAPTVAPRDGVPGMTFTFTMDGFRGAAPGDDQDNDPGEEIQYWANTPDGRVINTEPRTNDDDDETNDTKPLLVHANGHGEVTVRWAAPENAVPGRYTMVFHGKASGREVMIPFELHPDGWQTEVQTNVTPRTGSSGTEFVFIATGFAGAIENRDNQNNHGEDVSYWFNLPGGGVISTEPRTNDDDDETNDTKPLLHFADGHGTVSISWTAPANLPPGAYSIVIHGLSSHRQVLINFTIR